MSVTADNAFSIYLSSNDAVLGTPIGTNVGLSGTRGAKLISLKDHPDFWAWGHAALRSRSLLAWLVLLRRFPRFLRLNGINAPVELVASSHRGSVQGTKPENLTGP